MDWSQIEKVKRGEVVKRCEEEKRLVLVEEEELSAFTCRVFFFVFLVVSPPTESHPLPLESDKTQRWPTTNKKVALLQ